MLCVDIAGGRHLNYDYAIHCDSEQFRRVWFLGLAGFVASGIGVPLLIFTLVRKHRMQASDQHVRGQFGVLMFGYHLSDRRVFYESWVVARRMVLLCLANVPLSISSPDNTQIRDLGILGLFLVSVVVHIEVDAFDTRCYNLPSRLESTQLTASCVTIFRRLVGSIPSVLISVGYAASPISEDLTVAAQWALDFVVVVFHLWYWWLLGSTLLRFEVLGPLFRKRSLDHGEGEKWWQKLLLTVARQRKLQFYPDTLCMDVTELSTTERELLGKALGETVEVYMLRGDTFSAGLPFVACREAVLALYSTAKISPKKRIQRMMTMVSQEHRARTICREKMQHAQDLILATEAVEAEAEMTRMKSVLLTPEELHLALMPVRGRVLESRQRRYWETPALPAQDFGHQLVGGKRTRMPGPSRVGDSTPKNVERQTQRHSAITAPDVAAPWRRASLSWLRRGAQESFETCSKSELADEHAAEIDLTALLQAEQSKQESQPPELASSQTSHQASLVIDADPSNTHTFHTTFFARDDGGTLQSGSSRTQSSVGGESDSRLAGLQLSRVDSLRSFAPASPQAPEVTGAPNWMDGVLNGSDSAQHSVVSCSQSAGEPGALLGVALLVDDFSMDSEGCSPLPQERDASHDLPVMSHGCPSSVPGSQGAFQEIPPLTNDVDFIPEDRRHRQDAAPLQREAESTGGSSAVSTQDIASVSSASATHLRGQFLATCVASGSSI